MTRRERIALWFTGGILVLELLILWALLYFVHLPFFLGLLTLVLEMLCYFLTGVFSLAALLALISFRPGITYQMWKAHFLGYLRMMSSSIIMVFVLAFACFALGMTTSFLLRRVFALPTLRDGIYVLREWVSRQLY